MEKKGRRIEKGTERWRRAKKRGDKTLMISVKK